MSHTVPHVAACVPDTVPCSQWLSSNARYPKWREPGCLLHFKDEETEAQVFKAAQHAGTRQIQGHQPSGCPQGLCSWHSVFHVVLNFQTRVGCLESYDQISSQASKASSNDYHVCLPNTLRTPSFTANPDFIMHEGTGSTKPSTHWTLSTGSWQRMGRVWAEVPKPTGPVAGWWPFPRLPRSLL